MEETLIEIKKPWFKFSKNVEYSADFDFFCEHQLRIVKTGKTHIFCSRLEAKSFLIKDGITYDGSIPPADIEVMCRIIHSDILAGKYGNGEFVD